jgi:hypothetical protein
LTSQCSPDGTGSCSGLPVGVAAVLTFDWYFLPPLRALDRDTVLLLGTFLIMSVLVGEAATRASRRAISSERARGDRSPPTDLRRVPTDLPVWVRRVRAATGVHRTRRSTVMASGPPQGTR